MHVFLWQREDAALVIHRSVNFLWVPLAEQQQRLASSVDGGHVLRDFAEAAHRLAQRELGLHVADRGWWCPAAALRCGECSRWNWIGAQSARERVDCLEQQS